VPADETAPPPPLCVAQVFCIIAVGGIFVLLTPLANKNELACALSVSTAERKIIKNFGMNTPYG
jgi:hypothetical protein|tara:strand:- start:835 stop:1026 length:192 start_codon:yes stop_codon:yes gene_type:complete